MMNGMTYLYHRVPEDQSGTILYPLNQLKEIKPELYKEKASKYEGRKHIMERRVPILDCLWNDVLHLSPVPPNELKAALLEAGMEDQFFSYYQIDPSSLAPKQTVIYLHQTTDMLIAPDAREYVAYDIDLLVNLTHVPESTKRYFASEYNQGLKPLRFLGIPHILYRGSIDTSHLPIVTI